MILHTKIYKTYRRFRRDLWGGFFLKKCFQKIHVHLYKYLLQHLMEYAKLRIKKYFNFYKTLRTVEGKLAQKKKSNYLYLDKLGFFF